jgi:site-specific DNA-methyltransferase (adenine-specific)
MITNEKPKIELINGDCMEYMATLEDKAFDLAIVDPPYGNDNIQGGYTSGKGGGVAKQKNYNKSLWGMAAPNDNYFNELKRVSKNQIIWGANHLVKNIDVSSGWVVWDKQNGEVSFSDGELAFTSFNKGLRIFRFLWSGMLQGDMKNKESRIHPTQKPVKLYEWLLKYYAKEGDRILDTHLGSGSSAIAAYNYKFDFVGIEIDKDYYNDALQRFNKHKSQLQLF